MTFGDLYVAHNQQHSQTLLVPALKTAHMPRLTRGEKTHSANSQ
jgi:hypothetical protein